MTTEDQLALRALAYGYAEAVDTGDGDALAALFAADGAVETPQGTIAGHDRLSGLPGLVQGRYRRTFHAVLNQIARIEGDTAAATTYCIARHLLDAPGGNHLCYEMTIRYADSFARTAEGWRFARRRLQVDWTRVYPVTPGG